MTQSNVIGETGSDRFVGSSSIVSRWSVSGAPGVAPSEPNGEKSSRRRARLPESRAPQWTQVFVPAAKVTRHWLQKTSNGVRGPSCCCMGIGYPIAPLEPVSSRPGDWPNWRGWESPCRCF